MQDNLSVVTSDWNLTKSFSEFRRLSPFGENKRSAELLISYKLYNTSQLWPYTKLRKNEIHRRFFGSFGKTSESLELSSKMAI